MEIFDIEQTKMIPILEDMLKKRFPDERFLVSLHGSQDQSVYIEWSGKTAFDDVKKVADAFEGPGWSKETGSYQAIAWLSPENDVSQAYKISKERHTLIGNKSEPPAPGSRLVRFKAMFFFLLNKEIPPNT